MGTHFNYDDTSHQVIFDHINGGVGSSSLQQASQAWQRLGNDVGLTGKSFAQSAIRGILTTREGAAAEAAISAINAMLPWMDGVAVIAATAAQRAQGQADFWVTAKNNVPPVPPAPQSTGFLGDPGEWLAERMDWFPGVTSEEKAQQRQQDAAEQARQAMRVYQSSSNGNIDQAPAFTAPQALNGSIGALPLAGTHVAGVGAGAGVGVGVGVGAGVGAGAASAPAAGGDIGAHQAHLTATGQPAAYQPAATVSQLAHAPHNPPGNVAPGQFAGNPTPAQSATSGSLPVGTGFGGSTAGRDPARPAAAHAVAPRARSVGADVGRSGAGRAGFGPRPSTGFGPQPPISAPHPSVDEPSGTRGGAGTSTAARGAGGAGYGAPFAGGAGHRGEQDREHRSKYLVHDDSHSIVGDLPPTAPPVIGEGY